jgi:DNA-binding NtrC family response regulator
MSRSALAPIIGVSPAVTRALQLVERFAPTTLPILLVGPTGTGKDLFAQHIHRASRRPGQLVDINCGALPQEIAESLLFGHRRGAFTGAVDSVAGHFERADLGTLFLDEVLHLSVPAQVKLLRALETGEIQPLGGGTKRTVNVRVISAAQDDLANCMNHGAFRADLFQRLAGILIELPALTERPEDISLLAHYFAAQHGKQLHAGATHAVEDYTWPGNVRELRLTIERAVCLVPNRTISTGAVRDAIELGMLRVGNGERRVAERRLRGRDRRNCRLSPSSVEELRLICEACDWDASRAAGKLGIARSTLYNRLRFAGISLRSIRNNSVVNARDPKGSKVTAFVI